jgi:hypothetical protein
MEQRAFLHRYLLETVSLRICTGARRSNRNRLPNLQLPEGRRNGSKNAMCLVDYYNGMNDEQKS